MKAGDLVYIRTTGEPVVILSDVNAAKGQPWQPAHLENVRPMFDVRRPVISDRNGIEHRIDTLYDFELQTEEQFLAARILRAKNEAAARMTMQGIPDGERAN